MATVGPGITEFALGDRVSGLSPWALGAHAEFVCMPASGLIAPMPAGVSFAETAPVCDGGLNALAALRRAGLRKGQKILIYGASGSIGTAAVQLARHFGAEVTGVCNTKNVETVRRDAAEDRQCRAGDRCLTADYFGGKRSNDPGGCPPVTRRPSAPGGRQGVV